MSLSGAGLRAMREGREWSRSDLARRMRAVSGQELPAVASLASMIKEWEAGKHEPSRPYRVLLRRVFSGPSPVLDGPLSPDEQERLLLAQRCPARLDGAVVDSLAAILAAQRRLEDVIGPAALLLPVGGQLKSVIALVKESGGPHLRRLGRIAAEWATFTGWLHAAVRQDDKALRLLQTAEELADDFQDGTVAATATSFRGYVARQQHRPCAVIRASSAALATPGAHSTQRTFDLLQAAQGHAALGDVEQARRLLDQVADRAADAVEPPPSVYWYSEPFFRLNIGMVQAGIGDHRDAVDSISSGLAEMPADQLGAEWLKEYKDALAVAAERA